MFSYITSIKYKGKWYHVLAYSDHPDPMWLLGELIDTETPGVYSVHLWVSHDEIEECQCSDS